MQQPSISIPITESTSEHRKELIALCMGLFILGVAFSTWATRIPSIRDLASLSAVTLGYVLLFRGSGTIITMPLVAYLIHRFGAKRSSLVAGSILIACLIPLSLMPNWWALAIVLFVTGGAASTYNISINAIGSSMETKTRKSHMSTIHSWFGVGNLMGALVGSAAASMEVSPFIHFTTMAILLWMGMGFYYRMLPNDTPTTDAPAAAFKWPHRSLIWLGMICFMAATIESSINNWAALYFSDWLKVSGGLEPLGYASFAAALLMVRLIGDRLNMRFGAKRLVISGSILSTLGLVLALLTANPFVATAGFFMAGLGIGLNFPLIFSAAGKEGAAALTSVASLGYIGGMVSQPAMGWIVTTFGLVGGFSFIALCTLSIGLLATKSRLLRERREF